MHSTRWPLTDQSALQRVSYCIIFVICQKRYVFATRSLDRVYRRVDKSQKPILIIMTRTCFPCYYSFVMGIHPSPVPQMASSSNRWWFLCCQCCWRCCWINSRLTNDLRSDEVTEIIGLKAFSTASPGWVRLQLKYVTGILQWFCCFQISLNFIKWLWINIAVLSIQPISKRNPSFEMYPTCDIIFHVNLKRLFHFPRRWFW